MKRSTPVSVLCGPSETNFDETLRRLQDVTWKHPVRNGHVFFVTSCCKYSGIGLSYDPKKTGLSLCRFLVNHSHMKRVVVSDAGCTMAADLMKPETVEMPGSQSAASCLSCIAPWPKQDLWMAAMDQRRKIGPGVFLLRVML